jgi:hypothetical protein
MHQMQYTAIWDNVSFHRSAMVQNWFQHHPQMTVLYLPPYSLFLNPIEELFSARRWKVYDLQPQAQVPLIQAMEDACDQVDAAAVQGWIRHSRRFFPGCLANDAIACDVDEILGQIQLGEEIMYSMFTVAFSVQYCQFFSDYFFMLLFTVIVTSTGYSILRLSVC